MAHNFPTLEDFRHEAQDSALKWRNLPPGVYRIVSKRDTKSKFGAGMIMTLENVHDEIISCWACSRLAEQLKGDSKLRYVLNEGMKQSDTDPATSYFAFTAIRGKD